MPWLPQGWAALWDPTGARWAYLNPEMVSRVSWTPPVVVEDPSRGFGNGGQWGYHAPALAAPPYGVPAPVNSAGAVKDNSKKGVMMGAAGVAVGALGGVALNHALGSSFTLPAIHFHLWRESLILDKDGRWDLNIS